MNKQKNERILASMTLYFIQKDREHIAKLIAQSRLDYTEARWEREPNDDYPTMQENEQYIFYVPPILYQMMNDWDDGQWITQEIEDAIFGIMGQVNYQFRIELVEYEVNWRMRLIAESDTQEVTNQNSYDKDPIIYQGMRFSSPPEVSIAKALEKQGIMYFPNCLVRAGTTKNRQSRFPDFLILNKGKWGILEVDGNTFHTKQNATQDHQRTQVLQMHGIRVFHRYGAMRCKNDSDGVIDEFLKLLEMNG